MGRAILLLLVTGVSGVLVYWLVTRGTAPERVPLSPTAHQTEVPAPLPPTVAPDTSSPAPSLPAPRTTEQREQDALEAKREPFYRRLEREAGDLLTRANPASEEATLDLFAANDDDRAIDFLLTAATQCGAYRYGFRHIRLYLPNPTGDPERFRLAAESTAGDTDTWSTFRK